MILVPPAELHKLPHCAHHVVFCLVAVTADVPQEAMNMISCDLPKFHNILAHQAAEKPFQIQADRAHVLLNDTYKAPVGQKFFCLLLSPAGPVLGYGNFDSDAASYMSHAAGTLTAWSDPKFAPD